MENFEGGSQILTAREAFEAMRRFLRAFWERGDGIETSNDVSALLSFIEPTASGMPLDQAQWYDWVAAVKAVAKRQ